MGVPTSLKRKEPHLNRGVVVFHYSRGQAKDFYKRKPKSLNPSDKSMLGNFRQSAHKEYLPNGKIMRTQELRSKPIFPLG